MWLSVSNLKIPNALNEWEINYGKPNQIASALDIMIDGPIGAAAFNNEFGRPNTCAILEPMNNKLMTMRSEAITNQLC